MERNVVCHVEDTQSLQTPEQAPGTNDCQDTPSECKWDTTEPTINLYQTYRTPQGKSLPLLDRTQRRAWSEPGESEATVVRWLLLSFRLPNRKPRPSSLRSVERAKLQWAEIRSATFSKYHQYRKAHNIRRMGAVHSRSLDDHHSTVLENH
ncbi:MAG: hypothetical protein NTY15_06575 [Planctomycetota bacterium]|jgi:hypothetical protein|nr:hypothetical protein [Planctomycetota bacterium]